MTTTDAVRSEWTKVRTLRSTVGSLVAVAVATIGIGALVCGLRDESKAEAPGFDPLALSLFGVTFGQVAAISFGVLAVSQEFQHSALRVWLAAVPRRGGFYAAKMVVVAAAALVVGLLSTLVSFLLGQALIGDAGIGVGDQAAVRAIAGSGVYLALMALFAAGLTMVFRSGTLVLSVLIPFILIFPFVFNDAAGVVEYLPDAAGQLLVQQLPQGPIGPWASLAVTAGWAAAALLAGWISVDRRDA